jgi:hypothetical protein
MNNTFKILLSKRFKLKQYIGKKVQSKVDFREIKYGRQLQIREASDNCKSFIHLLFLTFVYKGIQIILKEQQKLYTGLNKFLKVKKRDNKSD